MLKKKKALFLIVLFSFVLLSCAGPSKQAVSGVQEGPSGGWSKDETKKVPGYGGIDKSTKESKKEKLPSSVKEVTPALSPEKTPPLALSTTLSKKDYIRARFPGKKVLFPDEITVPPKKPEYKVGADDILSVLVWNQPDLNIPNVTVRKDGMISFPLIGNVRVEGLTIPEIEEVLTKELTRFLKNPQVTVNPKEMNSQRVFIIAPIRRPAIVGIPILPFNYVKAGSTLLEALGDIEFSSDADLPASYITRGEIIIPVNIKSLLMDGDLIQNVLLEPGDRIVIPTPLKEVRVLGEVNGPERYKLKVDDKLLDALSLAKGVKRETADIYMAYVARNKQIIPVSLKRLLDFGDMSQNMLLEDGDIVYIPNIDEKKYYVLGEVEKPGVVFYKDPVDVVEAVAQGGGFKISAQRSQVVVVRGDLRSPQIYEIDMLAMLEGKSFERFPLQKGDIVFIPRTLIADWNVFITQLVPSAAVAALIDTIVR
jgi:polysaccharide export outer membrane protein